MRDVDASAVNDPVLEVFRLNGRLLSAGDAMVADLGLTVVPWEVLLAVARAPVPMSVAHMGHRLHASSGPATGE